jgi:methionyl-tRNA synthetase
VTHSAEVRKSFEALVSELETSVQSLNTSGYAAACTARSRVLNLYIDQTKPWALAKKATPEATEELREVLYTLLEGIRYIATALMPVLPFGMPEVFRQLDLPIPPLQGALRNLSWGKTEHSPGEPKPVYPRLEMPKPDAAAPESTQ